MSLSSQIELKALIADVTAIAAERLPAAEYERLAPYFSAYFEEAEAADLKRAAPLDLYGAAMAHLDFAGSRTPGQHKVRVYHPDFERHGWQSTHTAIEIVNDDMPFLIDSVAMLLARHNLTLHLLVHPVLEVERDSAGQLLAVRRTGGRAVPLESLIHLQVDRISDPAQMARIAEELQQVLADIRVAVEDEPAMRDELRTIQTALSQAALPPGKLDVQEISAFLDWVNERHFLLLGYCAYDLVRTDDGDALRIVPGSGHGILRNQGDKTFSASFAVLPAHLRELAYDPSCPIMLNKSQTRATIHRSAHLDFIGIKRYNADGQVVGECRFLGLYTAAAYHESPRNIPILRRKMDAVATECDYVENSYKAKTLQFVLESYPRDELFEIPVEVLQPIAEGLVNLLERPRVRLFLRTDLYQRYVSALVFVPRDSFSTEVRLKIEKVLMLALNGSAAEYSVAISDTHLARVHYIIRTPAGALPDFDAQAIELDIARIVRGWGDELHHQLVDSYGEGRGNVLFSQYQNAFPVAYREDFSPRHAVLDIALIEEALAGAPLALKLYKPLRKGSAGQNLKVFRAGQPASLSASLPVLENMGVRVQDERPYAVERADGATVWINDFGLEVANVAHIEQDDVRERFQQLLRRVAAGQGENDGFNKLALQADLDWHEVLLVRALAKYLRQAGLTFSQSYIEQCVANYPAITRGLVRLFMARLDPAQHDRSHAAALEAEVREQFEQVSNLDEDRILNGLLTIILAIRRTNYWQRDAAGQVKPYLSFKLESGAIPFLPQPRPLFEIWVYGARVEGVHLRGSKVARGGLRWSDRMEDFRTEVLGLVKAQMVKNSVIVPMGSKGGFVCKQLPPASEREAWLAEGVACYKMFISGLLDLTDNLVNGQIVPPEAVLRLDEDDPYLVVAADKGTATFSDIANSVSEAYGFWLGDAFASGGSAGYDHKKMGITARGAWESVKRHFRHLGINTQTQDFTVIGIGDMAGDVFGNGMLLSEHIRLLAAFNHQHIFLDPNPDAASSFAERARLFNLPRSSWSDYNTSLISDGGGVFERRAKSIPLSPAVRAWLGVERDSMAPNELIHAILQAPADLLYNGGIGTYIKASTQSHAEANDRANDGLRVNGNELRVKVIGEGGNLGITQLGRIECARHGVALSSDAIDNSAGVDCSDHEVNIKILLGGVMQSGDMTLKQRNLLLAEMTDEVGHLVLRNNYLQTQILAVNKAHAGQMLSAQQRMITQMEKTGELNRALEFLPDDSAIAERRASRQGLTSPEVAVLLAYSKISLDRALQASTLPDHPDLDSVLVNYFPTALQSRFADAMHRHPLKREIIANQLANQVVNRMGTTFIFRMQEESAWPAADITQGWVTVNRIFDGEALWNAIEALDNQAPADVQVSMLVQVRTLIERATRWLLRNARPLDGMAAWVTRCHAPMASLLAGLPSWIDAAHYPAVADWEQRLGSANVPAGLAGVIARLDFAVAGFDILDLAQSQNLPLGVVAANYFELGRVLQLDWLRDAITRLPRDNRWQALTRSALRDDLYRLHRELTASALTCPACGDQQYAAHWLAGKGEQLEVCKQMLTELQSYDTLDLAMLSAGMREVGNHLMR